jgi:hypothetical protein
MHSRRSLGDLISAGAGAAAAVQAGASGSGGTSAATAASTAAAARLTSVRDSAATTQRNAAQGTAIATAVTGALASLASAAGGPAGQWLSFLLGGTAAPPSTTIAPNDLKTLKDVITTAAPLAVATLTALKLTVTSDTTATSVLDYFIGYLPRVQAAVVAACTAAGPNCGVGATPPPAAAPPPPDAETPYVPPPAAAAQTSSEATYLLPVGAIALAAILFFLKR